MTEPRDAREVLRRRLRPCLAELVPPLDPIAEALLGEEEGVIDWLAVEPDGRAAVVLVGDAGEEPRLLTEGLAQRAWVAARLGDWRKFAPALPLRAELPPRLLLLAPEFSRTARCAAGEADPNGIRLIRYHQLGLEGSRDVRLETLPAAHGPPRSASQPPRAVPGSRFRTSLSDSDLELTPEERASLL